MSLSALLAPMLATMLSPATQASFQEESKCDHVDGTRVEIVQKEQYRSTDTSEPIRVEVRYGRGPVIVIDPAGTRGMPLLVQDYEVARSCVQLRRAEEDVNWYSELRYQGADEIRRVTQALTSRLETLNSADESLSIDCEGLDLLRQRSNVGYNELRELAAYYSRGSRSSKAIYRAKNILSCSRAPQPPIGISIGR